MKEIVIGKKLKCDVCKEGEAVVDAPTKMGPWAYMCQSCYEEHKTELSEYVGYKLRVKE